MLLFVLSLLALTTAAQPSLHIVSTPTNDVYTLLLTSYTPTPILWPTLDAALHAAKLHDALIVTNDAMYPSAGITITTAEYLRMIILALHVYLEMPTTLPRALHAIPVVPVDGNEYWRVVVVSNVTSLPYLTTLQPQSASVMPYNASGLEQCDLVMGLVAGYRRATFGAPNPAFPVLCRAVGALDIFIAATSFSNMITARYSPIQTWHSLWAFLLSVLIPQGTGVVPSWTPVVRPTGTAMSAAGGSTPATETDAFRRATTWVVETSNLLKRGATACPAPFAPNGVEPVCALEGYHSQILLNGSQSTADDIRMDCVSEMAMPLALRGVLDKNKTYAAIAGDLLDYTWRWSFAAQGDRSNSSKQEYGFVAWMVSPPEMLSYSDDNARVILSSMLASSTLRVSFLDTRCDFWDEMTLKSILGNYRIANPKTGFRPGSVGFADLEANGWEHYRSAGYTYETVDSPQPHYQTEMWAAFLWAHGATKHTGMLAMVEGGVEQTMSMYPEKWKWTEYISEEQCRLVLTLAWLVRVTNNATHLEWLKQVATDYTSRQQPSGAIQERLGTPGLCAACPPSSNAGYGTGECGLMQDDTDTVTDQLYSNNYALFSLWEAYKATGDYATFGAPADKLASYLVAIQTTSEKFPFLSGGWPRAFDYELWEYYGSSSDWGWGAYSIETGWTASWISTTLSLRTQNISFWEFTQKNFNATSFAKLCLKFLPSGECY